MTRKRKTYTARYKLYTDGSCIMNPGGPGGWGAVLLSEDGKVLEEASGSLEETTSNRAELTAVIEGVKLVEDGCLVQVYSDSKYVVNCGNGYWGVSSNIDLWDLFFEQKNRVAINMNWVKGHAGDVHNERADELAGQQTLNSCRGKLQVHSVLKKGVAKSIKNGYVDVCAELYVDGAVVETFREEVDRLGEAKVDRAAAELVVTKKALEYYRRMDINSRILIVTGGSFYGILRRALGFETKRWIPPGVLEAWGRDTGKLVERLDEEDKQLQIDVERTAGVEFKELEDYEILISYDY